MPRPRLSHDEVEQIVQLRRTGHSLPEIRKITKRANDTVFKYIKNISILPEYKGLWQGKRGGSKRRSLENWEVARRQAFSKLTSPFNSREKLLIMSCLYWGEGNKRELSLINSDPYLIRTYIHCLKEIGINQDQLKVTLRVFEDMDVDKTIEYWLHFLHLPKSSISNVNILQGKKEGKLKYGMCRVRARKSANFFKLIMSMIDLIKSDTLLP